jgi:hypothetical protein
MVETVDLASQQIHTPPYARIQDLRNAGYTFVSQFTDRQVGEVLHLWGNSFEWDRRGVKNLARDLHANHTRSPADRSVWFSAILSPRREKIVALATAERLNVPINQHQSLPIIETTEWRRADGAKQHGLAAAVVSHLNAQILDDLREQKPLIVAETNFMSGAHNVGFAAGMEVPPRRLAGHAISQMLIQNVRVGDGLVPDGLRDFTMMHLSQRAIQNLYDRTSTRLMLKGAI